jgi:hypothetical protein
MEADVAQEAGVVSAPPAPMGHSLRSGEHARRWGHAGRQPEAELVAAADGWHADGTEDLMEKRTLEQLEAALDAVSKDLAPRVEELAQKSTEGALTPEEHKEYAEVVRLNDTLSLLKLQAEEFWTMRAAS